MKLTDLLELLEPDAVVWIATGADVEQDPDAELVAQGPLDKLRLADVLGHSSIETTRIYLTTSGAEHAQQLNRLGLIL